MQLSLLGSVVSNLLLVMGTAFIAGGIKTSTQRFNQQVCAPSFLCHMPYVMLYCSVLLLSNGHMSAVVPHPEPTGDVQLVPCVALPASLTTRTVICHSISQVLACALRPGGRRRSQALNCHTSSNAHTLSALRWDLLASFLTLKL